MGLRFFSGAAIPATHHPASGGKMKKFYTLLYVSAVLLGLLISLLTHYLPILVNQGVIPALF